VRIFDPPTDWLDDAANEAIRDFDPTFTDSLSTAAVGQLSSLLMAELANALDLDGFEGTVFQGVGATITGRLLDNTIHVALGEFNQTTQQLWTLFDGFDASSLFTSISGTIGGVLGSSLAAQIVMPTNPEGSIGGSIGSSIGAYLGTIGIPIPILGTAIGAFLGELAGTVIGSIFGNNPHAVGAAWFDPATGTVVAGGSAEGGGDAQTLIAFASQQAEAINALVAFTGGHIDPTTAPDSSSAYISYNTGNHSVTLLGATSILYTSSQFNSYQQLVPYLDPGVMGSIHIIDIAGGDILMRHVWENSQAGNASAFAADLQIASDYRLYRDNAALINAIMAAEPESAFTTGWALTLLRAQELGLTVVGEDVIGDAGDNVLVGTRLNDIIDGGAGNDTLDGGAGNDLLRGGAGADTFLFGRGSGQDTIVDSSGPLARVVFGPGITASDVTFLREGLNVKVLIAGTNDTLTFPGRIFEAWWGTYSVLATFELADGTVVPVHLTVQGTAGADTLAGTVDPDYLIGGLGNDLLKGSSGDDIYIFNRGDGTDTILDNYDDGETTADAGFDTLSFGNGIAASDIMVKVSGLDLVVGVRDPANPNATFAQLTDKITLQDWMGPLDQIEAFHFADGQTLDLAGIISRIGTDGADTLTWTETVVNLDAGAGNDSITAGGFDDVLRGGAGVDTLNGAGGNDQLYGDAGNDNLSGGAGNDVLDGGTGNDSMSGGSGSDTFYVDSSSDTVSESSQSSGSTDLVYSSVSFTLDSGVENLTLLPGATTGTGNNSNNIIIGNAGNNTLSGQGGDDTLDGGAGSDTLTGGNGNDIFVFNRGDGGGDTITTFAGNGASAGDSLRFVGYGTAAEGATLTQIGTTNQWQINSADGLIHDIITLSNNASVHASDYVFM
jgi:Ca2+-binding RTX toxin-like protein